MRRHAPATLRNREPIRAVLARVLPAEGTVLEVAAGTGEHAVYFAKAFPELQWQPTDPSQSARESIAAYREGAALPNLLLPLALDATSEQWPVSEAAAMVAINLIHISPIEVSDGLFRGAGAALSAGAPLATYGPYRVDGQHTAPSNEAFDHSLRSRDARWGIRDIGELETLAEAYGLQLEERVPMPANNWTLIWRRQP